MNPFHVKTGHEADEEPLHGVPRLSTLSNYQLDNLGPLAYNLGPLGDLLRHLGKLGASI